MLQGLGLSGALERVSNDAIDKIEDAQGNSSLILDPETKILKKLSLKYRDPSPNDSPAKWSTRAVPLPALRVPVHPLRAGLSLRQASLSSRLSSSGI